MKKYICSVWLDYSAALRRNITHVQSKWSFGHRKGVIRNPWQKQPNCLIVCFLNATLIHRQTLFCFFNLFFFYHFLSDFLATSFWYLNLFLKNVIKSFGRSPTNIKSIIWNYKHWSLKAGLNHSPSTRRSDVSSDARGVYTHYHLIEKRRRKECRQ